MTFFFLSVFFCRDIENQQNKKGTREGVFKKIYSRYAVVRRMCVCTSRSDDEVVITGDESDASPKTMMR